MKLEYLGKDKRISFWNEDIEWFLISTRGKEDKVLETFEKELKLNIKHQFGWKFRCSKEEILRGYKK